MNHPSSKSVVTAATTAAGTAPYGNAPTDQPQTPDAPPPRKEEGE